MTDYYRYWRNCVDWPRHDAREGLQSVIDNSIDITRKTFLSHVHRRDRVELEKNLGYETNYKCGLTIASDWAVTYHRSEIHGKKVYYLRHSAIEYVFARLKDQEVLP